MESSGQQASDGLWLSPGAASLAVVRRPEAGDTPEGAGERWGESGRCFLLPLEPPWPGAATSHSWELTQRPAGVRMSHIPVFVWFLCFYFEAGKLSSFQILHKHPSWLTLTWNHDGKGILGNIVPAKLIMYIQIDTL